ncbi:unnamed protein product [Strongylus vulgaris]|uniref:Transposase Helix-turn-helix domain-containing protein n=1 Tax=Strongylus vulgaris TaxID=40348 RepID=A0A3P7JBY5_STRVU|nr:unnamed protein product [Strongylus vulgaris]
MAATEQLAMVLIILRYLATNSHQTVIADCFGISQKAVSDVVTQMVDALNQPDIEARFPRFWPSGERWCLRRPQEFAKNPRFTSAHYVTLSGHTHQTVIADCFGISQKAVSDVVTRMLDALNQPISKHVSPASGLLMNGGACEDLENLPRTRDLRDLIELHEMRGAIVVQASLAQRIDS